MDVYEIEAQPRTLTGKGAVRRLRRTGLVPGVLFGGGKDPISFALDSNELKKRLAHEGFVSHILTVALEGSGKEQAVLKDVQRLPGTPHILHIDLQRVVADQEITMNIPLHFVNEESCPGRKAGGVISHLMVDVEVRCLPSKLPEYIEVDVAALDIGNVIHLAEIVLPEGVELTAFGHGAEQDEEANQAVVSVHQPQHLDVEPEAEAADAALLEPGAVPAEEGEASAEEGDDEARS